MKTIFVSFIFLIGLLPLQANVLAQCDFRFEYEVVTSSENDGSIIHLKLLEGATGVTYKAVLHNLITGKDILQVSQRFDQNKAVPIFSDVRPSRYCIYIFYPGCKEPISLGGIKGINIR